MAFAISILLFVTVFGETTGAWIGLIRAERDFVHAKIPG